MITKRLLATAVAGALLLAACGGDDEADDAPEPTADAGGDDTDTTEAPDEPAADVVTREDGESYEDYIDRLYAAAAEEGSVIYYQSAGESELDFIREQWEALFPDVAFEPVTARAGTILERALLEVRTGNTAGDVFGAAGAEMLILETEGALQEYDPAGLEFVPEDFQFDGPYVGLNYLSRHPTYNTDNVDPADLPDDWFGYCEPEWNGRIGLDAESFEWAAAFLEAWGEERTRELLECIAANNPVMHRGTTAGTELVNVGEFDVKLDGMGHVTKRFELGGAPIMAQIPAPSPLPAIVDLTGILEGAPHPNAARLLQEFFLMPEGQLAMAQEGKAVPSATAETHPYWDYMEGSELAVLGPAQAESLNQGVELFAEYFG